MKQKSKVVQPKVVQPKVSEHKGKRDKLKVVGGIMVALFFGLALYLRVALPYDEVFTQGWIKLTSNDAYYYMRIVDNLAHNFPRHMEVDPYCTYPAATGRILPTFFMWLLATIIWVIGLGSPSQHTADVIAAYLPAVLGALTTIPVYFIGKELVGRWAGIIAAGLIALLPGEFLGRSILGFTEHHVAEALLTTVAMLFLIKAIKAAKARKLTFQHIMRQDWQVISKPFIYSLLTGIFLGAYLLTWMGALLFVFIITVYFIIQFISDYLRGRSTDYLCLVGTTLFFIALITSLTNPILRGLFYLIPLIVALFIPLVLSGVSRLMIANKQPAVYYPLSLIGLGLAGVGIFYLINPYLIRVMLAAFKVFTPTGAQLTTIEMQPILFPTGQFTLALVLGNFSTALFLSLVCLGSCLILASS